MQLLAAVLLAQAAPATPARDIVVTGRPLSATERAWRDCLDRKCPPDELAAAALRHAENLFVAGRYPQAHSVVGKALSRVGGEGRTHPLPVSDLWRSYGRIAFHRGLNDLQRASAIQSVMVLKRSFGADDPRVMAEELELADVLVRAGEPRSAVRAYERVAARAERLGNRTVQGGALLRAAMVELLIDKAARDPSRSGGRRALERLKRTADPALATYREAADALLASLDTQVDEDLRFDKLAAHIAKRPSRTPVLLHAPPIEDPAAERRAARAEAGDTWIPDTASKDQWIDLAYRIGADGHPHSVEVLRKGPGTRGEWVDWVLTSVRGRRYAPLALEAGSPGVYRVERVTRTSPTIALTGSRIVSRTGAPQIAFLDLTAEGD